MLSKMNYIVAVVVSVALFAVIFLTDFFGTPFTHFIATTIVVLWLIQAVEVYRTVKRRKSK